MACFVSELLLNGSRRPIAEAFEAKVTFFLKSVSDKKLGEDQGVLPVNGCHYSSRIQD